MTLPLAGYPRHITFHLQVPLIHQRHRSVERRHRGDVNPIVSGHVDCGDVDDVVRGCHDDASLPDLTIVCVRVCQITSHGHRVRQVCLNDAWIRLECDG